MDYYVLGMTCFLAGWAISYFVAIWLFGENKKQSIKLQARYTLVPGS